MSIHRVYMCGECGNRIEVTLSSDQWDQPAPSCPACDAADKMGQEFHVNIGGSLASRAAAITEDIMRRDYGISNYTGDNREGGVGKVNYASPPTGSVGTSQWAGNMLQEAISIGRKTRMEGGSGLDILQRNLKSGAQPDLIEASKQRAIKVW